MGYFAQTDFSITTTIVDATGAATDTDTLPTAAAYRNGKDISAQMALTVTKLATGAYSINGKTPGTNAQRLGIYVVLSFSVDGVASHHTFDDLAGR